MYCFVHAEVVNKMGRIVDKSYCFQNTKAGSGIWPRLSQWRMPFLASPQTLSQTWLGYGEKWSQFMQGQETLVSRCRGKSSDIQLHQHNAPLLSV